MNNIKQLRKNKKITVSKLAQDMGVTQSTMTKIENSQIELKASMAQKIADYFGVLIEDLVSNSKGNVLAANTERCVSIDVLDFENTDKDQNNDCLPQKKETQFIDVNFLHKLTKTSPCNIKILSISGDSMSPTINDQDVLWVDVSVKAPKTDGLYLLSLREDVLVKRLRLDLEGKNATILSDNPLYPPLESSIESINIIGKIIAITKKC